MKQLSTICCVATLIAVLTGCNTQAPVDTSADEKAIRDIEAAWNQEYAAKDADKAASHYAEDAVMYNPGIPAASGREAIHKVLKDMVTDPAFSLSAPSSKVYVSKTGDLAIARGTYTFTMTEPNSKQVIHDHGNYMTLFRKQPDGHWLAIEDMATSEVPPPAPPAPAAAAHKGRKRK